MDRRPEDAIVREQLGSLTEPERDALSAQLAAENSDPALIRLWRYLARPAQLAPPGNWRLWLVMAGRGFGKTRAGAEWVRALARRNRFARIALVGASLAEARAVMVEGESGLLNLGPPEQRPVFEPSTRRLRWPNGALGLLYSAAEPESLRGPQHSHAWCDEIAKWDMAGGRADNAWSNLVLGLRLGRQPQAVCTTTPRAVPLLHRLMAREGTVLSGGTTHDNAANLPGDFLAAVEADFGGTALGRQELGGELLTEVDGALWSRALLERCRMSDPEDAPERVVIGVDPPASARGDECGIVVCAAYPRGHAAVLADCSIGGASPEGWARAVAEAASAFGADRVVAEANQGGEMVRAVLSAADQTLPVRLVHARRGKIARAEPVAALYEAGRVRHAGQFARLEDQLCGMMAGGTYEGPGRSPDRADALVWALTELLLTRRRAPSVRRI